jgi:lysophospholipase L1-like esterase
MITYVLAGAASALIGMASGQALVLTAGRRRLAARLALLEQQVPELISRNEVQNAFAQVAQIEAQRQAQAQAQVRAAAVFGGQPPAMERGGFNGAINAQLEALQERVNRINAEFGAP